LNTESDQCGSIELHRQIKGAATCGQEKKNAICWTQCAVKSMKADNKRKDSG